MPTQYKIVLVGPANSGKTALVNKLINGEMEIPSLGFLFPVYQVPETEIELQIRDIPSKLDATKIIERGYMAGANAILLACDLSDPNLEENLKNYSDKIDGLPATPVPVILVGTKFDLVDPNVDHLQRLSDIATKMGPSVKASIITSAANGANIGILFNNNLLEVIRKNSVSVATKTSNTYPVTDNLLKDKPVRRSDKYSKSKLGKHLKDYRWQYAIGTLLMLGMIAMFAVPGAMPVALLAFLLSTGLGMTAALALFGTLAAVLAFFTPVIVGYGLRLLGLALHYGTKALVSVLDVAIGIGYLVGVIATVLAAGLTAGAILLFASGVGFVGRCLGSKRKNESLIAKILTLPGRALYYLANALGIVAVAVFVLPLVALTLAVIAVAIAITIPGLALLALARLCNALGQCCLGKPKALKNILHSFKNDIRQSLDSFKKVTATVAAKLPDNVKDNEYVDVDVIESWAKKSANQGVKEDNDDSSFLFANGFGFSKPTSASEQLRGRGQENRYTVDVVSDNDSNYDSNTNERQQQVIV